jgi:hypothetical protein
MQRYTDLATKAADQVLDTVGSVQDTVVSTVAQISEYAGGLIPAIPGLPLEGEMLPRPRELADQGFSIAERALKAQKKYVANLFKAFEPISAKFVATNGKSRKTAAKA